MNRDKKYIGGIVALFLAAFAWGSAYTVMKSNLEIFRLCGCWASVLPSPER